MFFSPRLSVIFIHLKSLFAARFKLCKFKLCMVSMFVCVCVCVRERERERERERDSVRGWSVVLFCFVLFVCF